MNQNFCPQSTESFPNCQYRFVSLESPIIPAIFQPLDWHSPAAHRPLALAASTAMMYPVTAIPVAQYHRPRHHAAEESIHNIPTNIQMAIAAEVPSLSPAQRCDSFSLIHHLSSRPKITSTQKKPPRIPKNVVGINRNRNRFQAHTSLIGGHSTSLPTMELLTIGNLLCILVHKVNTSLRCQVLHQLSARRGHGIAPPVKGVASLCVTGSGQLL